MVTPYRLLRLTGLSSFVLSALTGCPLALMLSLN